jgi:hypothetical protein
VIIRLAALALAGCLALAACDSDGPPPIVHPAAPTHVITGPTPTSQVKRGVVSGAHFDSPYTGPWSYTIDAVGGVGSLTVDAAT